MYFASFGDLPASKRHGLLRTSAPLALVRPYFRRGRISKNTFEIHFHNFVVTSFYHGGKGAVPQEASFVRSAWKCFTSKVHASRYIGIQWNPHVLAASTAMLQCRSVAPELTSDKLCSQSRSPGLEHREEPQNEWEK